MQFGGAHYMVEKPLFQEPQFIEKLGPLTNQIKNVEKNICQNSVTDHEIEELIHALELYTVEANIHHIDQKKMSVAPENEASHQAVNERIEQALEAVLSFNKSHPKATQKNVTDLIASLFSNLQDQMGIFEESVKNLKEKWKAHVEKIQHLGQSKES
jgi:hypothetical protein